MNEGSWFRDRADTEMGATPEPPDDRLEAVVARVDAKAPRRLAELAAAASMVLVSVVLVVLTVMIGRGGPAADSGGTAPAASTGDGTGQPGVAGSTAPASGALRTGAPVTTSRLGRILPGVVPTRGPVGGPTGSPTGATPTRPPGGTPTTTPPRTTPPRTTVARTTQPTATPPVATTAPPTTAPPPT